MAEPSVEELKKLEVKDDDEVTPGYKAPAKVDLKTLQELDADDESLQKYKKDLLGAEGMQTKIRFFYCLWQWFLPRFCKGSG